MDYNFSMKQETLQSIAESLWLEYCEIFPKLVKFDCPKIVLNNRLSATAGRCFSWKNEIDLASKFFIKHKAEMLRVILPHELAHQIDVNLYGAYNRDYHRQSWKTIMVKIGLPPDRCHNMKL